MSEVKARVEEQFGELRAAVTKAQADVMLFLEEKETTEDEMVEWHHQLDGREFE